MSTPNPDTKGIFYIRGYKMLRRFWYFNLIVVIGGTIYFIPLLFRDHSFLPFLLLWICVCIYSLTYYYRMYRITRLIISEEGIEYTNLKYQLTTYWGDLSLARNRTILSLFSPLRVTTKNPIVKRNYWFDWDFDVLWGKSRYFIPLSSKIWDRYNDIEELIKHYRPDLLLEQKK
jgi:hypothetical protein